MSLKKKKFGSLKRIWKNLVFQKEKQAIPTITKLTFDNILISYFKYLALFFQQFPPQNLTEPKKHKVYPYCIYKIQRHNCKKTKHGFFS